MNEHSAYKPMRLKKYSPSPFRDFRAWLYWHILGRPRTPQLSDLQESEREALAPPAGGVSIYLRHLDCGSCNGCELALQALNTPDYDLPGHGIHFVASPRHADVLIMTGALTYNLQTAALHALDQLPAPHIIAVGDCAIDGGPFREAYGVIPREDWPEELLEAIVQKVPGCPPDPNDILEALQRLQDDRP